MSERLILTKRIDREVARSRRITNPSFTRYCCIVVVAFLVFTGSSIVLGPKGNFWTGFAVGFVGVLVAGGGWRLAISMTQARYLRAIGGSSSVDVDVAALFAYDSAGEVLASEVRDAVRGRMDFLGMASSLIRYFGIARSPEEWLALYDRLFLAIPGCDGLLMPLYLGGFGRNFDNERVAGLSRVGDLIERFGDAEYSIVAAARFCELGAEASTSGEDILKIYDRVEVTMDAMQRGLLV